MVDRIRVATLQYYIRPVRTLDDFQAQVVALVQTAADYQCQLMVFPEYFTAQLLTLGDIAQPMPKQIRRLARYVPDFVKLFAELAKQHNLYIVAGTLPVMDNGSERVYNHSFIFAPNGQHAEQGKLHMTRFEKEEWHVSPRKGLKIFKTEFGPTAITICYDVEFPELARVAAQNGAHILLVPSCTDDRQGYLRVRYCAHARAIENQMFVIQSPTVGSLPMVPAVSLNWGQAAIMTPSDFSFARDGIVAEGVPNQETMVIGELNLKLIAESRKKGTVLPLRDSQRTAEVAADLQVVKL